MEPRPSPGASSRAMRPRCSIRVRWWESRLFDHSIQVANSVSRIFCPAVSESSDSTS